MTASNDKPSFILAGFDDELSRWQLDHVEEALSHTLDADIERLEVVEGDDLLKRLREGEASIVVLDARALPKLDLTGVDIAASSHRGVVNDAIVCHEHLGFRDLPPGANISVTPGRRKASLLSLRDDLKPLEESLTIDERLAKIDSGDLDSAMFSWVELRRLGLAWRVDDVFGVTELLPEPLAGITAILVKSGDREAGDAVAKAGHGVTLRRLRAELAFVNSIEAKPGEAIACHSRDYGVEGMRLVARVFTPDGKEMIEAERSTQKDEQPELLGEKVAAELLERGAAKILGR